MTQPNDATGGAGATTGAPPAQPAPNTAPPATPPAQPPAAPAAPAPGTGASSTSANGTAFDPSTLSPEAQAYLARARADAEAKARTTAKETAAAAARDGVLEQIAQALNLKPAQVDPAKVGADLAAAQAELRTLRASQAIGAEARSQGLDESLVTAVLAHGGKLAALDPTAADFATQVKVLVTEAAAANPRLKLDTAPAPGAVGAVGSFNGNGGQGFAGTTLASAIGSHYATGR